MGATCVPRKKRKQEEEHRLSHYFMSPAQGQILWVQIEDEKSGCGLLVRLQPWGSSNTQLNRSQDLDPVWGRRLRGVQPAES